jgi:hypothetical protein
VSGHLISKSNPSSLVASAVEEDDSELQALKKRRRIVLFSGLAVLLGTGYLYLTNRITIPFLNKSSASSK